MTAATIDPSAFGIEVPATPADEGGIAYRGFTIQARADRQPSGFWTGSHWVESGWIVARDGRNALPDAPWFETLALAEQAADAFIQANGDRDEFWRRIRARFATAREP